MKFIGPKEVLGASVLDEKLFDNSDIVEIAYKDGSKEVMTKKMFEVIQTDEATDLTNLRHNRAMFVSKDILQILLQWGVVLDEVNYIQTLVNTSLNENFKEAEARLWGKSGTQITLVDMDKILRK